MPDLFGEETLPRKRCKDCKQMLPLEDFPFNPQQRGRYRYRRTWCRKCNNKRQRKYYERTNGKAHRRCNLRSRFGLSVEEYEQMHQDQDGKCAICGATESIVRGKLRSSARLSVDHSHTPGGKIRGLLCNRCNRAIGLFEDNAQLLLAAAGYLQKHHEG